MATLQTPRSPMESHLHPNTPHLQHNAPDGANFFESIVNGISIPFFNGMNSFTWKKLPEALKIMGFLVFFRQKKAQSISHKIVVTFPISRQSCLCLASWFQHIPTWTLHSCMCARPLHKQNQKCKIAPHRHHCYPTTNKLRGPSRFHWILGKCHCFHLGLGYLW